MDDERLKGIVEALAGSNVLSYALKEGGVLVLAPVPAFGLHLGLFRVIQFCAPAPFGSIALKFTANGGFVVPQHIGYFFLACFIRLFVKKVRRGSGYKYRCGNCGQKLREKGQCPHCGAVNE